MAIAGSHGRVAGVDGGGSRRKNVAQEPDFAKMTTAEKLAWNQARWKRILG